MGNGEGNECPDAKGLTWKKRGAAGCTEIVDEEGAASGGFLGQKGLNCFASVTYCVANIDFFLVNATATAARTRISSIG